MYAIKRRVESKNLIILVDSFDKIKQYIDKVPLIAHDLIKSIDTPLTIIYPNAKKLAKNVIARDGTIAIRVVKDEFCQQVIKEFGKPVVSSSANVSGEPNPIIFSKISDDILNSVDYVVNVYRDRVKETKPSRIIKLEENFPS